VIIAKQKNKSKFLSLVSEYGAHAIDTIYARGSASQSILSAAFSPADEQSKVMITCLMKKENAKKVIDLLYSEYDFEKPNTGFAYAIAVDGLAF